MNTICLLCGQSQGSAKVHNEPIGGPIHLACGAELLKLWTQDKELWQAMLTHRAAMDAAQPAGLTGAEVQAYRLENWQGFDG